MKHLNAVCAILLSAASAIGAEVSSPRHSIIAADQDRIVRFDADGGAVWKLEQTGPVHRIQLLPNGNVLTQDGWTRIIEVTPGKDIVWEYDAATANGNAGKQVEVHAFQRLNDGRTMIVENGVGRIIEVDRDGTIQHELKLKVSKPNPHSDVRQAYKLKNGNYLVSHEADGRVVEYAPNGDIAWEYDVPLFGRERKKGHGPEAFGNQVYNAIRLENGNTLIATGNGHSLLEVTPEKEIVWSLHQNDLPGITLAWLTGLEVLPSGNILFGNCHAGPKNPQLIEVTRDKEVVWTFRDFDLLGNGTAASAVVSSAD